MRIKCRVDDSFPKMVEDWVHRRADLKLSRFADVIQEVSVTVQDVNGPRGGIDVQCIIRVKMGRAPLVIIREMAESPGKAIIRAFDRAARTVARQSRRQTDSFEPGRLRDLASQSN